MKYTLKKKWHPSQVEEVGHVFNEEGGGYIFYRVNNIIGWIMPHEIALLVDAGYLMKQLEKGEYIAGAELKQNEAIFIKSDGKVYPATPTLDLWTTEPPKGTVYEFVDSYGNTDWCVYGGNDWDKFRLKTGNCHKTPESAKEALKRLLEK